MFYSFDLLVSVFFSFPEINTAASPGDSFGGFERNCSSVFFFFCFFLVDDGDVFVLFDVTKVGFDGHGPFETTRTCLFRRSRRIKLARIRRTGSPVAVIVRLWLGFAFSSAFRRETTTKEAAAIGTYVDLREPPPNAEPVRFVRFVSDIGKHDGDGGNLENKKNDARRSAMTGQGRQPISFRLFLIGKKIGFFLLLFFSSCRETNKKAPTLRPPRDREKCAAQNCLYVRRSSLNDAGGFTEFFGAGARCRRAVPGPTLEPIQLTTVRSPQEFFFVVKRFFWREKNKQIWSPWPHHDSPTAHLQSTFIVGHRSSHFTRFSSSLKKNVGRVTFDSIYNGDRRRSLV